MAKSDLRIRVEGICHLLLNTIEIYIPAMMLICLFVSFIVGIVFRYIFRDPQSWTFELSSISFLQLVILSGCFVQRKDEHIVFDMIYSKRTKRTQCLMRIVGGIIICITAILLTKTAVEYVGTMVGLKTQIIKWPRWCVFACFPATFLIMGVRAAIRVAMDTRALVNKTYEQTYPAEKGASHS